jgi:glycosyltransferase involved in cell wall biosynthesis
VTARGVLLAMDYPPVGGGIARLLGAWASDTDLMAWRIVTTSAGPNSDRVVRASSRMLVPRAVLEARRWLRRADQRVVVAGHPYLAGAASIVAAATGARSACAVFGLELIPRRATHRAALAPLRAAGRVIAISEYTAAVAARAGARDDRTRVVLPRLRAPWLAERPSRRERGGLHVAALTRLNDDYKNVELLIRVAAVLHPLGVVDRVTVIGGGPRLAALRAHVSAQNLARVVEFTGHLPDIDIGRLLQTCHVGAFPSRDSGPGGFEGFGLVVHELAAAGLPVLVGAAAGAVDAAHDPWAVLLDPDDLSAWVSVLQDLHANEHKRWSMACASLAWMTNVDPLGTARDFASALLA